MESSGSFFVGYRKPIEYAAGLIAAAAGFYTRSALYAFYSALRTTETASAMQSTVASTGCERYRLLASLDIKFQLSVSLELMTERPSLR
jgi:hypothetical protein